MPGGSPCVIRPAVPDPNRPTPLAPAIPALVLAGRRRSADPVALAAGASHKALVPVAGVPMLVRVIQSLRAARSIGRITVSIDDPTRLAALPSLAALRADGALVVHQSLDSPSASVRDALQTAGSDPPVLVTTADHPLLTAEMGDHFVAAARGLEADVVAAVVTEDVLRRHHPESPRTIVPLRGEGVTGANLFLLRTAEAERVVAFWARTEGVRKRPWRLVSLFGPIALARFALRTLDLDAAARVASRRIGARVAVVRLPFAEAAIDVDRPADLALATRILSARESGAAPG